MFYIRRVDILYEIFSFSQTTRSEKGLVNIYRGGRGGERHLRGGTARGSARRRQDSPRLVAPRESILRGMSSTRRTNQRPGTKHALAEKESSKAKPFFRWSEKVTSGSKLQGVSLHGSNRVQY